MYRTRRVSIEVGAEIYRPSVLVELTTQYDRRYAFLLVIARRDRGARHFRYTTEADHSMTSSHPSQHAWPSSTRQRSVDAGGMVAI